MAFYLKRAFENDDRFHVFNDIRFEVNGDAAQINHMVVCMFGFFIIESKSISGQISINEHNEWARVYKGKPTGIPSPILQAKRQGDFICSLLHEKRPLFSKVRKFFDIKMKSFLWKPIVAISDQGIIQGTKHPDEIMKADQVSVAIIQEYDKYRKKHLNPLNLNPPYWFANSALEKICSLLLRLDTPLGSPKKTSFDKALEAQKVQAELEKESDYQCKACNKSKLEITYGKFGYYFKCLDCDANTGIPKAKCDCGAQLRVSKKQKDFSMTCKECDSSEAFWENK